MNILLVDDNVTIINAMTRVLRSLGHTIQKAEHGLAAIALLHDSRFDLVISDVEMPEMDGISFVRWLMSNDKETLRRTVLFSGRPEIVPNDIPVPVLGKGRYLPCELVKDACNQLQIINDM